MDGVIYADDCEACLIRAISAQPDEPVPPLVSSGPRISREPCMTPPQRSSEPGGIGRRETSGLTGFRPWLTLTPVVDTARAVSATILSSGRVGPAAKRLSHRVAGAPRGSPLRILSPIRAILKGEAAEDRVLQIMLALDDAGVQCWLAGGWGIDALVGHQTRRHDDVDIVVSDFPGNVLTACDALFEIGFHLSGKYQHPTWMPDQWTLEDNAACRIDLLSIDWGLLGEATATFHLGTARADLLRWAVTEGMVGGRRVRCLSAPVQLVFHSGFESRHVDSHDLANLAMHRPPTGDIPERIQ